jgi:hypothetical protein
MPDGELYMTAFYFTVTTLVTVGYGDITPYSIEEKLLCILLMLIGVISFSFATGALASIITSHDSKEALIAEKIATLNEIQMDYDVNIELFNKLARTIKFDYSKKQKDILQFIEELPHKLRLELSMVIHSKMYQNIPFFRGKDSSFIVWMATSIKSLVVECEEYIYQEGEDLVESKQS